MVFVNSKKFACESCIKGHRSSSCHHAERPLFEIKKKGRPISQCDSCRRLRQSRSMHTKCTCPQDEPPRLRRILLPSSSKSKRNMPIAPALPNGLRDALPVSSRSALPLDSRQRVDSLLNPCNCCNVSKCRCRAEDAAEASSPNTDGSALVTLAHAAAACCCPTVPPTPSSVHPGSPAHPAHGHIRPKCIPRDTEHAPSLELPPLLLSFRNTTSAPTASVPTFATMPTMPPLSTITSLAGSGCTCGLECACPGCVEHRGHEHADSGRASCAQGCGTCVDVRAGLALPGLGADYHPSFGEGADTIIERFLARAAALPLPPTNRTANVDPTNVLVGSPAAPSLPKLQCCGGQCACPDGGCDCRKTCDGGCAEHHSRARAVGVVVNAGVAFSFSNPRAPPTKKGCCGGK